MNVAVDQRAAVAAVPTCTVPVSRVDFTRPLVCIFGLPFDAIGVAQAVQRIRADAFGGRRCFVSTPNLNFAIAARSDAAFRDSVLHSDLSLVDGMPLVWIARLLGLPVRERVSGADVFEALQAHAGPALTVYFFGGPPGVAASACERINRRGGGVRCVGFDSPGFGSVESMSSAEQVARINASGAHLVAVSLGAQKGQAWIERNAARLTAPVLSHLGAVVNFAAGSVRRAPRWMRWCGLEWAWRIREEPSLWRRYWRDGTSAAGLTLTRVLPDAFASRPRRAPAPEPARLEVLRAREATKLVLFGCWRHADLPALREALTQCAATESRLTVDLSGVSAADNALVAILLAARGWFATRAGFEIVGASPAVEATFRRKLAEALLTGID